MSYLLFWVQVILASFSLIHLNLPGPSLPAQWQKGLIPWLNFPPWMVFPEALPDDFLLYLIVLSTIFCLTTIPTGPGLLQVAVIFFFPNFSSWLSSWFSLLLKNIVHISVTYNIIFTYQFFLSFKTKHFILLRVLYSESVHHSNIWDGWGVGLYFLKLLLWVQPVLRQISFKK